MRIFEGHHVRPAASSRRRQVHELLQQGDNGKLEFQLDAADERVEGDRDEVVAEVLEDEEDEQADQENNHEQINHEDAGYEFPSLFAFHGKDGLQGMVGSPDEEAG